MDCLHTVLRFSLTSEFRGEESMPHYEYLCHACNKKFSVVMSIAEHEKNKIKCPKCGGAKVEQQWAAFHATTSKKS
jgi:putative FmdB family regulatory protein